MMKLKKLVCLTITMISVLLLSTTVFATYSYGENISPPADNVSQIIGDGNTVVFIDVPSNYWAKDQIDYFSSQGIIDGYTDGSFKPEAGVTREEFCKLLVSTFKQPLATPNTPTFADVLENRWSYPYVEVCREFLTGYANPFGGAPSFHPTEYATREDIAVALVRMMGFTDKDASNPNYAAYNFRDGGSISPNLLAYVSIACERGLISGYPDGTFGPTRGITRAETVVLLNRATKQAVTNINAELEMTASVFYSDDGKTATINIVAEEGTTVTVNGESVKMSSNYYGEYEGNYVYKFEKEGSKDFAVEGKRGGKTKIINATAKYEIGVPVLKINSCPTNVTTKSITISGTMYDKSYSSSLTINGESIASNSYADYAKEWSVSYTLKEGENTFEFVLTNAEGKSVTETKTVNFSVGGPVLKITKCPTNVTTKNITISGTMYDKNYSSSLTINGESIASNSYADYAKEWSMSYTLQEGENTFEFVLTNAAGKSVTETKTVNFSVGGPVLKITKCPTNVTTKNITIGGTMYDKNYSSSLTINGESVASNSYTDYAKEWSVSYTLQEGENTFEFVLTNAAGKSVTETKTVNFSVGGPVLKITKCPTNVTTKNITIGGTMYDKNYSSSLTINGESVASNSYTDYAKEWSVSYTLQEGENTFEFVLTNAAGKSVTETKTINFKVGGPELKITECPSSVTTENVTIRGTMYDSNYSSSLMINGESIASNSYSDYEKSWSQSFTLEEGINTFEFVLTNSAGKSVTEKRTIDFRIGDPKIQFINCPDNTKKNTITVKGKITGENKGAMLFIDDEEVYVNYSGEFSETVELKEGDNTFEFRAVNEYGKEVSVTKTITYAVETEFETEEIIEE